MTAREDVLTRKSRLAAQNYLSREDLAELAALNARITFVDDKLHVDGKRWKTEHCQCGCWSAVDLLGELA
jgi:hypothetical protein